MPAPAELLSYIDANTDAFIARLSEAVSIASISGGPAYRPKVLEMSDWLNSQLRAVGVETRQADLGTHFMDGHTLPLPPAILGRIDNDKSKKTVLIYGHFDFQPASKSDGWDTEPFVLVEEKDGRLVGRGSTDDKGPVLGWLGVLLATTTDSTTAPPPSHTASAVSCTSRLLYLVPGATCTLVCTFGRTVHEPMVDFISLMSRLVDSAGNILVSGVDDMVSAADVEERAIYDKPDYVQDVQFTAGGKIALSADKRAWMWESEKGGTHDVGGVSATSYLVARISDGV
ncbi:hypothetical protein B0H19DRAFT_1267020 [Mycena capillaripes]|nr:hypothetical protein B0H19DRAFT_1267020 [Mycena capillaripes]